MENLQPSVLWNYFSNLTTIPRPSKKEEKVIAYLLQFAQTHQLQHRQDATGNLLIYKEATAGYENKPAVILQAHVDMVCEKNSDSTHNFETDAIQTYIDGDWLKAKGTTLGADNGIGVAMMLAILSSTELKHPALECLFTVDEETGLTGAYGLDKQLLSGKLLINLDSEDDGEVFIGCAGGIGTQGTFTYQTEKAPSGYEAFQVMISGLKGGHSGGDIHSGHANSIKLLSRMLWRINLKTDLRIASIDGGNLHNAIPREASALIVVPANAANILIELKEKLISELHSEFDGIESDIRIRIQHNDVPETVMEKSFSTTLLQVLYAIPHGVIAMSKDMPDLVETSTNLASIKMLPNSTLEINTSQRSSVETVKNELATRMLAIFSLAGATVVQSDGYPGWKPNLNSKLLRIAKQTYTDLYQKKPEVRAIHAGLECGLFLEKYPHLDMISIGPQMHGVHSPDERLSISSTQKTWKWLIHILQSI